MKKELLFASFVLSGLALTAQASEAQRAAQAGRFTQAVFERGGGRVPKVQFKLTNIVLEFSKDNGADPYFTANGNLTGRGILRNTSSRTKEVILSQTVHVTNNGRTIWDLSDQSAIPQVKLMPGQSHKIKFSGNGDLPATLGRILAGKRGREVYVSVRAFLSGSSRPLCFDLGRILIKK